MMASSITFIRHLSSRDREGGIIIISNLGTPGVEMEAPLVTEPQAVTLFAGSLLNRPAAVRTAMEVRPTCSLEMADGHRVLDGATTAKCITTVKRHLEVP